MQTKPPKPVMLKFVSLSSDIDVSAVTIENWLIHTYYLMNISPVS